MAKKKEGTYANEFHKSLIHHFTAEYLFGAKLHGSMYQKKGLSDYVYCADPDTFNVGFIGLEAKFVPKKKLPKRKALIFDKLLRPDQLTIGIAFNNIGNLGLQLTILQLGVGKTLAIVTVIGESFTVEQPLEPEIMALHLKSDHYKHTQGYLTFMRKPGDVRKVPDHLRYPKISLFSSVGRFLTS